MRVSQEFDVVRSETKTLSSLRQDEDGCCVAHIVWDDGTRTSTSQQWQHNKKRSQRQNIEAAGPVAYPLSPCGRKGMAAMAEGGTA